MKKVLVLPRNGAVPPEECFVKGKNVRESETSNEPPKNDEVVKTALYKYFGQDCFDEQRQLPISCTIAASRGPEVVGHSSHGQNVKSNNDSLYPYDDWEMSQEKEPFDEGIESNNPTPLCSNRLIPDAISETNPPADLHAEIGDPNNLCYWDELIVNAFFHPSEQQTQKFEADPPKKLVKPALASAAGEALQTGKIITVMETVPENGLEELNSSLDSINPSITSLIELCDPQYSQNASAPLHAAVKSQKPSNNRPSSSKTNDVVSNSFGSYSEDDIDETTKKVANALVSLGNGQWGSDPSSPDKLVKELISLGKNGQVNVSTIVDDNLKPSWAEGEFPTQPLNSKSDATASCNSIVVTLLDEVLPEMKAVVKAVPNPKLEKLEENVSLKKHSFTESKGDTSSGQVNTPSEILLCSNLESSSGESKMSTEITYPISSTPEVIPTCDVTPQEKLSVLLKDRTVNKIKEKAYNQQANEVLNNSSTDKHQGLNLTPDVIPLELPSALENKLDIAAIQPEELGISSKSLNRGKRRSNKCRIYTKGKDTLHEKVTTYESPTPLISDSSDSEAKRSSRKECDKTSPSGSSDGELTPLNSHKRSKRKRKSDQDTSTTKTAQPRIRITRTTTGSHLMKQRAGQENDEVRQALGESEEDIMNQQNVRDAKANKGIVRTANQISKGKRINIKTDMTDSCKSENSTQGVSTDSEECSKVSSVMYQASISSESLTINHVGKVQNEPKKKTRKFRTGPSKSKMQNQKVEPQGSSEISLVQANELKDNIISTQLSTEIAQTCINLSDQEIATECSKMASKIGINCQSEQVGVHSSKSSPNAQKQSATKGNCESVENISAESLSNNVEGQLAKSNRLTRQAKTCDLNQHSKEKFSAQKSRKGDCYDSLPIPTDHDTKTSTESYIKNTCATDTDIVTKDDTGSSYMKQVHPAMSEYLQPELQSKEDNWNGYSNKNLRRKKYKSRQSLNINISLKIQPDCVDGKFRDMSLEDETNHSAQKSGNDKLEIGEIHSPKVLADDQNETVKRLLKPNVIVESGEVLNPSCTRKIMNIDVSVHHGQERSATTICQESNVINSNISSVLKHEACQTNTDINVVSSGKSKNEGLTEVDPSLSELAAIPETIMINRQQDYMGESSVKEHLNASHQVSQISNQLGINTSNYPEVPHRDVLHSFSPEMKAGQLLKTNPLEGGNVDGKTSVKGTTEMSPEGKTVLGKMSIDDSCKTELRSDASSKAILNAFPVLQTDNVPEPKKNALEKKRLRTRSETSTERKRIEATSKTNGSMYDIKRRLSGSLEKCLLKIKNSPESILSKHANFEKHTKLSLRSSRRNSLKPLNGINLSNCALNENSPDVKNPEYSFKICSMNANLKKESNIGAGLEDKTAVVSCQISDANGCDPNESQLSSLKETVTTVSDQIIRNQSSIPSKLEDIISARALRSKGELNLKGQIISEVKSAALKIDTKHAKKDQVLMSLSNCEISCKTPQAPVPVSLRSPPITIILKEPDNIASGTSQDEEPERTNKCNLSPQPCKVLFDIKNEGSRRLSKGKVNKVENGNEMWTGQLLKKRITRSLASTSTQDSSLSELNKVDDKQNSLVKSSDNKHKPSITERFEENHANESVAFVTSVNSDISSTQLLTSRTKKDKLNATKKEHKGNDSLTRENLTFISGKRLKSRSVSSEFEEETTEIFVDPSQVCDVILEPPSEGCNAYSQVFIQRRQDKERSPTFNLHGSRNSSTQFVSTKPAPQSALIPEEIRFATTHTPDFSLGNPSYDDRIPKGLSTLNVNEVCTFSNPSSGKFGVFNGIPQKSNSKNSFVCGNKQQFELWSTRPINRYQLLPLDHPESNNAINLSNTLNPSFNSRKLNSAVVSKREPLPRKGKRRPTIDDIANMFSNSSALTITTISKNSSKETPSCDSQPMDLTSPPLSTRSLENAERQDAVCFIPQLAITLHPIRNDSSFSEKDSNQHPKNVLTVAVTNSSKLSQQSSVTHNAPLPKTPDDQLNIFEFNSNESLRSKLDSGGLPHLEIAEHCKGEKVDHLSLASINSNQAFKRKPEIVSPSRFSVDDILAIPRASHPNTTQAQPELIATKKSGASLEGEINTYESTYPACKKVPSNNLTNNSSEKVLTFEESNGSTIDVVGDGTSGSAVSNNEIELSNCLNGPLSDSDNLSILKLCGKSENSESKPFYDVSNMKFRNIKSNDLQSLSEVTPLHDISFSEALHTSNNLPDIIHNLSKLEMSEAHEEAIEKVESMPTVNEEGSLSLLKDASSFNQIDADSKIVEQTLSEIEICDDSHPVDDPTNLSKPLIATEQATEKNISKVGQYFSVFDPDCPVPSEVYASMETNPSECVQPSFEPSDTTSISCSNENNQNLEFSDRNGECSISLGPPDSNIGVNNCHIPVQCTTNSIYVDDVLVVANEPKVIKDTEIRTFCIEGSTEYPNGIGKGTIVPQDRCKEESENSVCTEIIVSYSLETQERTTESNSHTAESSISARKPPSSKEELVIDSNKLCTETIVDHFPKTQEGVTESNSDTADSSISARKPPCRKEELVIDSDKLCTETIVDYFPESQEGVAEPNSDNSINSISICELSSHEAEPLIDSDRSLHTESIVDCSTETQEGVSEPYSAITLISATEQVNHKEEPIIDSDQSFSAEVINDYSTKVQDRETQPHQGTAINSADELSNHKEEEVLDLDKSLGSEIIAGWSPDTQEGTTESLLDRAIDSISACELLNLKEEPDKDSDKLFCPDVIAECSPKTQEGATDPHADTAINSISPCPSPNHTKEPVINSYKSLCTEVIVDHFPENQEKATEPNSNIAIDSDCCQTNQMEEPAVDSEKTLCTENVVDHSPEIQEKSTASYLDTTTSFISAEEMLNSKVDLVIDSDMSCTKTIVESFPETEERATDLHLGKAINSNSACELPNSKEEPLLDSNKSSCPKIIADISTGTQEEVSEPHLDTAICSISLCGLPVQIGEPVINSDKSLHTESIVDCFSETKDEATEPHSDTVDTISASEPSYHLEEPAIDSDELPTKIIVHHFPETQEEATEPHPHTAINSTSACEGPDHMAEPVIDSAKSLHSEGIVDFSSETKEGATEPHSVTATNSIPACEPLRCEEKSANYCSDLSELVAHSKTEEFNYAFNVGCAVDLLKNVEPITDECSDSNTATSESTITVKFPESAYSKSNLRKSSFLSDLSTTIEDNNLQTVVCNNPNGSKDLCDEVSTVKNIVARLNTQTLQDEWSTLSLEDTKTTAVESKSLSSGSHFFDFTGKDKDVSDNNEEKSSSTQHEDLKISLESSTCPSGSVSNSHQEEGNLEECELRKIELSVNSTNVLSEQVIVPNISSEAVDPIADSEHNEPHLKSDHQSDTNGSENFSDPGEFASHEFSEGSPNSLQGDGKMCKTETRHINSSIPKVYNNIGGCSSQKSDDVSKGITPPPSPQSPLPAFSNELSLPVTKSFSEELTSTLERKTPTLMIMESEDDNCNIDVPSIQRQSLSFISVEETSLVDSNAVQKSLSTVLTLNQQNVETNDEHCGESVQIASSNNETITSKIVDNVEGCCTTDLFSLSDSLRNREIDEKPIGPSNEDENSPLTSIATISKENEVQNKKRSHVDKKDIVEKTNERRRGRSSQRIKRRPLQNSESVETTTKLKRSLRSEQKRRNSKGNSVQLDDLDALSAAEEDINQSSRLQANQQTTMLPQSTSTKTVHLKYSLSRENKSTERNKRTWCSEENIIETTNKCQAVRSSERMKRRRLQNSEKLETSTKRKQTVNIKTRRRNSKGDSVQCEEVDLRSGSIGGNEPSCRLQPPESHQQTTGNHLNWYLCRESVLSEGNKRSHSGELIGGLYKDPKYDTAQNRLSRSATLPNNASYPYFSSLPLPIETNPERHRKIFDYLMMERLKCAQKKVLVPVPHCRELTAPQHTTFFSSFRANVLPSPTREKTLTPLCHGMPYVSNSRFEMESKSARAVRNISEASRLFLSPSSSHNHDTTSTSSSWKGQPQNSLRMKTSNALSLGHQISQIPKMRHSHSQNRPITLMENARSISGSHTTGLQVMETVMASAKTSHKAMLFQTDKTSSTDFDSLPTTQHLSSLSHAKERFLGKDLRESSPESVEEKNESHQMSYPAVGPVGIRFSPVEAGSSPVDVGELPSKKKRS